MKEKRIEKLLYKLADVTSERPRTELAEDIKNRIPQQLSHLKRKMDTVNIIIDLRVNKLAAAAVIIVSMILLANIFNGKDTGGAGLLQESKLLIRYFLAKDNDQTGDVLPEMSDQFTPSAERIASRSLLTPSRSPLGNWATQKHVGSNLLAKTQRPFTAATLKGHLKQTNDRLYATLRQSLAEWVLAFRQRKMTVDQMRDAVSAFVRTHFVDVETAKLTEFLDSDSVDFEPPKKACANTFVSDAGDVIEVGTVHSVKGETHTATLYLETFNYALDLKRLLPFCLGKYPAADAKKARHRANLKIAHVAFSRPTDLLAFACCSENVAGHEAEFMDAGWVVRKI